VTISVEERFWSKVPDWYEHRFDDACWEWTAAKSKGYGRFRLAGSLVQAHCIAYELEVGPIPDGMDLDHLCHNRGCVRPTHLEPVTRQENFLRGLDVRYPLRRDGCPHGHTYPENLHLDSRGYRYCRACNRDSHRKTRERKTLA